MIKQKIDHYIETTMWVTKGTLLCPYSEDVPQVLPSFQLTGGTRVPLGHTPRYGRTPSQLLQFIFGSENGKFTPQGVKTSGFPTESE